MARWALALACAAVACHAPQSASRTRELVVNLSADADVLLPPFTSTTQGAIVADQIFERLADPDSMVNTIGDRTTDLVCPIGGPGPQIRCRSRFTSIRAHDGRTACASPRATCNSRFGCSRTAPRVHCRAALEQYRLGVGERFSDRRWCGFIPGRRTSSTPPPIRRACCPPTCSTRFRRSAGGRRYSVEHRSAAGRIGSSGGHRAHSFS